MSQNVVDLLIAHLAFAVSWKRLKRFKETLEFALQLETPAGIAFQTFLNDGGKRLITYQHFAPVS
ncbi:MAG: hypothetical protein AB2765_07835 [Candidatus Thiodiazotropha endolucinida]